MPCPDPERRSKRPAIVLVIVFLLLLLLLYVASIGPALALAADGKLDVPTYVTVYAPVEKAAKLSDPTHQALRAYQNWWEPGVMIFDDGRYVVFSGGTATNAVP